MKLLDKDGLSYYTDKIKNELTDYVKNTDYASDSTGGVIKSMYSRASFVYNGVLLPRVLDYATYGTIHNESFISKGTLENVITGKGLTTKSYVDSLVGDIGTILDSINGESVGD